MSKEKQQLKIKVENGINMGMTTEFKFNAIIKSDTPEEVINLFKRLLCDYDLGHDKLIFNRKDMFKPNINHKFFECERWYMLFISSEQDNQVSEFLFNEGINEYVLTIHSEFKNYDNEINEFVDWIKPYVKPLRDNINTNEGVIYGHSIYRPCGDDDIVNTIII